MVFKKYRSVVIAVLTTMATLTAGGRFVPLEKIDWNQAETIHEHLGKPVVRLVKIKQKVDSHRIRSYLVRVDLAPHLKFTATPRAENWGEPMPPDPKNNGATIKTVRERTLDFAKSVSTRQVDGRPARPIVAFNTSPWGPWPAPAHLYASPYSLTISDGEFVCGGKRYAHFVVYKDGTVDIVDNVSDDMTNSVWIAHGGFQLLMKDGKDLIGNFGLQDIHPRLGVGITPDKKTLYLLAVDGRLMGWSDGANLPDMVNIFKAVGVSDAINMDGGGSTSLCVAVNGELKVLNFTKNRETALNICIYE